jgi:hypothetical protein
MLTDASLLGMISDHQSLSRVVMEQALHSFEPTRPEQISHRYLLSHGSPERPGR